MTSLGTYGQANSVEAKIAFRTLEEYLSLLRRSAEKLNLTDIPKVSRVFRFRLTDSEHWNSLHRTEYFANPNSHAGSELSGVAYYGFDVIGHGRVNELEMTIDNSKLCITREEIQREFPYGNRSRDMIDFAGEKFDVPFGEKMNRKLYFIYGDNAACVTTFGLIESRGTCCV